jgi:hypothetical protein
VNLRKDHYRTSLTVVKHCVRENSYSQSGFVRKNGTPPAGGARRGAVPESQALHVSSASLGYLRFPLARVHFAPGHRGEEARARIHSLPLRRFKERLSLPPHDAQPIPITRNQLESPTLEGGSGDAPHSDGRRVLAVAATCRPVKQKYNS